MGGVANKTDAGAPLRQIRFVNNQGQPPSKRRRINAACLTCRRRKTRCAGERPKCSTCTKNGHGCLGYPEENSREFEAGHGSAPDLKLDPGDDYKPDDRTSQRPSSQNGHGLEDMETDGGEPLAKRSRATFSATPQSPPKSPHTITRKTPPLEYSVKVETHRASNDQKPPPQRHQQQSHFPPPSPKQQREDVKPTPDLPIDDLPTSPTALRRPPTNNHRVPYFRYFGPTAIVPGFKQMVVSVRDRRRSTGGSHSGTSPMSTPSNNMHAGSSAGGSDVVFEEPPIYDVNEQAPVHPLILSLVRTFFTYVGCNYPFLKNEKFTRAVQEKRVEPILVDAVCALAARFADPAVFCIGNDKLSRADWGHAYATRAKQATVDTFPCPSVGAVQACLLMAYEGFGANQDSALWMYLGLAIRMAVDLGLQKRVGIQYQGEKDPWNQKWNLRSAEHDSPEDKKSDAVDALTLEEQREVEQERIDTFWAVFVLDRVISSGTGRPVTFRDDDYDIAFPAPDVDPTSGWPRPFPVFLEIIHLYGRVCDVLNNVRNAKDLTSATWVELKDLEVQLTSIYHGWSERLQFSVENFKMYLGAGQGTTFILLHLWFHALFIILHQPTLITPFSDISGELHLVDNSRELSMSSAKTICDILAFADLTDAKSFIGNPFSSQPIYIAACAFLMESSANASEVPSRAPSPSAKLKAKTYGSNMAPDITKAPGANRPPGSNKMLGGGKPSRHSLLASAATLNYQRCYNSLQHLHLYWGGVKYILTALDQKSKGIWDCETYTSEEYESTKLEGREGSIASQLTRFDGRASPKPGGQSPFAWCVSGRADSGNPNLTVMYQNNGSSVLPPTAPPPPPAPPVRTPPGNMIYDPIRPHASEVGSMLPPTSYPQPTTSAVRHTSPRRAHIQRPLSLSALTSQSASQSGVPYDGGIDKGNGGKAFAQSGYTTSSQHSSSWYDPYGSSPRASSSAAPAAGAGVTLTPAHGSGNGMYYPQHGMSSYQAPWGMGIVSNIDTITFDSQDIDIGALGLQQPELMSEWWNYIPGDVLGLFEQQDLGPSGHES